MPFAENWLIGIAIVVPKQRIIWLAAFEMLSRYLAK
jgi:hypothetical protein